MTKKVRFYRWVLPEHIEDMEERLRELETGIMADTTLASGAYQASIDLDKAKNEAIALAVEYGDLERHQTWVIDQMVRKLAGINYNRVVAAARDGEDGPHTYNWDVGIAP